MLGCYSSILPVGVGTCRDMIIIGYFILVVGYCSMGYDVVGCDVVVPVDGWCLFSEPYVCVFVVVCG